ncbi:unnamed protein product [Protopolystoma xenopodis]|uniref:Uncharacterized protein n=1 Tax=Protopolystoma xenopodis TaxID=117903 RepID=A0A448WYT1_9PLAT|nr:unnamed protein product [Protopolystoma xenopodis]
MLFVTVQTKAQHSFIGVAGRGAEDYFTQFNSLPHATILLRFPVGPHHKLLPTNFPFEMESHATVYRWLAILEEAYLRALGQMNRWVLSRF